VLVRLAVGVVLLIGAVGALGYAFHAEIVAISAGFLDTFGPLGIAIGFFLPDAFALPFIHDAFSFFGLVGGMGFWEVVAWASTGSLLGGAVGYWLGGRMAHTVWFQQVMAGRGAEAHALIDRYGIAAVAIGALSPFPYSIVCWASGALAMDFRVFLAVSLLRIPRVAFYLWLIQLGFMTVI
jgi:membrane protein YqaA with SNARE-associated domain